MKLLKNLRLGITAFPVLIFSALIIIGFFNAKAFTDYLWTVFKWIMINFGWLTDLGCLAFVITLIAICLHPLGRVKLGGPDAKPTFSTWNWWAISLCAGIGTGIVFWGSVEPLKHAFAPAAGMGLEAGSDAAIIWAMRTSFLHWTFTPYAIYTIPAVAIGLAYYNMKERYSVSSGLTLLNSKKPLNKSIIGIVDGITLFAITGGVAGSLGYGLLQIGSGLEQVFGIKTGPVVWIATAAAIIASYTISSSTGLNRGIKWLSDKNAILFIIMLVFVIVFGPTAFIFNLTTQSIGSFATHFIEAMTFTDSIPTAPNDLWPQWWDMYWFVDWLSFGPIIGLFLVRLAYGRTLREFIVINMVLPASFGMLWFGAFGAFAIDLQIVQNFDLVGFMNENGIEAVMLKVMEFLPLGALWQPLMIFIIALSFVTLADSMTSTVALMSLKNNDQVDEAPLAVKVFWGMLMGCTSLIFVLNGGIEGIKVVKTLAGFPILVIEIIMMFAIIWYLYSNSLRLRKEIAIADEQQLEAEDQQLEAEDQQLVAEELKN